MAGYSSMYRALLAVAAVLLFAGIGACAGFPYRDPLFVDVAGVEPLASEGMELRLAVTLRIQNPSNLPIEYTGAALELELNGRALASGVSDRVGVVPRYGEMVVMIPVTISAFDMARQVFAFMREDGTGQVRYGVRGKLEGGLFRTRRFQDEGTFLLDRPSNGPR